MSDDIKNIIILGNSGSARECYMILKSVMWVQPNIKFKGFLSFEGYQADLLELSDYFLGNDDDYNYQEDDYVVIGIGDPRLRQKAFNKLKAKNANLYNLIHTYSYFDSSSVLGEGNIITCGCSISCNAKIGDGNYFNGNIIFGHDVEVGNFNFIAPSTHILAKVNIGDFNSIGALSVFLPDSKIGNNNIIAPLSAIYKGFKDNCYIQGNPALKIGEVGNNQTIKQK